ncbi:hypothetical protein [uncultured Hymenobacter sp.]|uniref:hypothetical protein n=1 Tax=uncultured Hymenobacter sp. TaxID=170016 RepID=UPI0035C98001
MRKYWLVGSLGLLLGGKFSAAAQRPKEPDVPFGRANTVLVQTATSSDSVLTQLRHHLATHGFVLDSLDKTRGLLTTRVQASSQTVAGRMKIRAIRVGEVWKLTGLYLIPGPLNSGATAFPAEFLGLESAPNKTAFREVIAAAHAIPRGTLRYSRGKVRFGAFTKLEDALKMPW